MLAVHTGNLTKTRAPAVLCFAVNGFVRKALGGNPWPGAESVVAVHGLPSGPGAGHTAKRGAARRIPRFPPLADQVVWDLKFHPPSLLFINAAGRDRSIHRSICPCSLCLILTNVI